MADVVDKATRSRMMAGIRGKDTRPELVLRHALHRLGYRYRLHGNLPGKPDLVFPGRKAVIFVHGCFWHCHDCHLFKWPSTRKEFWEKKIKGNRLRDAENHAKLRAEDWRILTVWECAMKGKLKWAEIELISSVSKWLDSNSVDQDIIGVSNVTDRSAKLD